MISFKALQEARAIAGTERTPWRCASRSSTSGRAQALEAFEKAVKALGRKDFERALDLLDALIEAHPQERDLIERARSYRAICERGLEKRPRPKTFEDFLNYGVYLHNRGEYPEALKALQHAAEIHPKNEHVLYCLAAVQARTGDRGAAHQGPPLGHPCQPGQPGPGAQRRRLRPHPRRLRLRGPRLA